MNVFIKRVSFVVLLAILVIAMIYFTLYGKQSQRAESKRTGETSKSVPNKFSSLKSDRSKLDEKAKGLLKSKKALVAKPPPAVFYLDEKNKEEDTLLSENPLSMENPEHAKLGDPIWQEMAASLIDWQPIFDEDWECRKRFSGFGDGIYGCAYERTLVVERIGPGLGRVRHVRAEAGPESRETPACAAYVNCTNKLWLGMIFPMPDDAPSPSAWREHGMIPQKGTLPQTVQEIDKLISEYEESLEGWKVRAESDSLLGFKVLYTEDMIGTWKKYREKLLAGEVL